MIPIYRAKSNERNNTYVEGFLIGVDEDIGLCTIRTKDDYIGGEICYLHTLSIHFEDMIDIKGDKIFASLQEDGKGGSIANYNNKGNLIAMYIGNAFMWVNVKDMQKIGTKEPVSFLRQKPLAKMVTIGIQE